MKKLALLYIIRQKQKGELMRKYLILASKSKRRTQILSSCGIRHKVFKANVKEHPHTHTTISRLVVLNARKKAEYAARFFKDNIILGVDTLVLLKGKAIGKPKDKKHALSMLKNCLGKTIIVYTGLCIIDTKSKKIVTDIDKTSIRVKRIDKKDIGAYFELMKPYDKAGAFSIEGAGSILFDNLKGSYFNVLGLSTDKLEQLLKKAGYNILDFIV